MLHQGSLLAMPGLRPSQQGAGAFVVDLRLRWWTVPQAFETATACPAGQFGRALI